MKTHPRPWPNSLAYGHQPFTSPPHKFIHKLCLLIIGTFGLNLGMGPCTSHAAPTPISSDAPLYDLATAPEGRLIWNKVGFDEGGVPPTVQTWRSSTRATTPLYSNLGLRNKAIVISWPYVLFFEGETTLRRMAPSGRLIDPPLAVGTGTGLGRKGELAALEDFAYWTDNAGIHRVPVDGGPIQSVTTARGAGWLALDRTHVYWRAFDSGVWGIFRAPVTGGSAQRLYWASSEISYLTVDEAGLYWVEGGVYVLRGPKAPFTTPLLIQNSPSTSYPVQGLVVDSTHLYWTQLGPGTTTHATVRRSPKDRSDVVDLALGRGAGRLAQDSSYIYWNDQNGIYRLEKSAPPISAEFSVQGLEITQAIQSLNNQVQLIADKPTFVRVYAEAEISGASAVPVEVVLRGFRAGVELPGSPLHTMQSTFSLGHRVPSQRSVWESTANFSLPASWRSSSVRLVAEINPGLGTIQEANHDNNTVSRDASFVRKAGLCLLIKPLMHTNGTIYRISDPTFPTMLERLKSIYPVADFRVRELAEPLVGPDGRGFDVVGNAHWTINHLNHHLIHSDAGGCDRGARRFHVGLVDNSANTTNMGGYSLPFQACWVKMMTGGSTAFETPFGGIAWGHELAHTMGWVHVDSRQLPFLDSCGAAGPFDVFYPYPPGLIDNGRRDCLTPWENCGRFATEAELFYGYDPISSQVIRPLTTYSFMGYCFPQWIADTQWRDLAGAFDTLPGPPPAPLMLADLELQGGESDYLDVSGILSEDGKSASFGPTFHVPAGFLNQERLARVLQDQAQFTQPGSSHALELVGLDGKVLLTQPFDPIPGGSDAVVPQPASFSLLVPLPPGVVAARVVASKTEIGRLKASPSSPGLTLFSPKGGETFQGSFQIAWSGKDPDGDKVSYLVQYSHDDGQSWQVLALDYQAESFVQSTEHLPGGKQCRVRVLVSDGFRSTVVTSLPFIVETHAPFARIAGPADQSSFLLGEEIRFAGFAYDVEDGSLGDQALSWSIDGSPRSVRGSELVLQDLLPGLHKVELQGTDSEGRAGTASITVVVVRPSNPSGGDCTLVCPPNLVKGCDSPKGTVIEFALPQLMGDCAKDLVVQCSPPSGSLFPIGETIVVCRAIDSKGNQVAECKFTITVQSSLSIETAVCVRWTCGLLQSAPGLNGPWTDVPGATSPYYSSPGEPRRYYRVK